VATEHKQPPDDADAKLLVDIDLAILGAPRQRFDQSDAQIRSEYGHLAEAEFRAGRRAVLSGFLARPRLYNTSASAACSRNRRAPTWRGPWRDWVSSSVAGGTGAAPSLVGGAGRLDRGGRRDVRLGFRPLGHGLLLGLLGLLALLFQLPLALLELVIGLGHVNLLGLDHTIPYAAGPGRSLQFEFARQHHLAPVEQLELPFAGQHLGGLAERVHDLVFRDPVLGIDEEGAVLAVRSLPSAP
jgi:hypothetical protein